MRSPLSLTLAAGLVVALVGCDAAGPEAAATDARKSDPGFLVQTTDAAGNSSEHRQERAAVCHYDDETATYELLSVGAPALSAHLRHGDGVPGGIAEGAPVFSVFDDACEVVEAPRFTCDVEYGTNALGQTTALVSARAIDPALIPIRGAGSTVVSGRVSSDVLIYNDDGVVVGTDVVFVFLSTQTEVLTTLFTSGTPSAINCGFYGAPTESV